MLIVATPVSARVLSMDDFGREQTIWSAPEISPDGAWLAYVISAVDAKTDRSVSRLWMMSWDGQQSVPLTHGQFSVSAVRWSPDGRLLTFLSTRYDSDAVAQVWALDRRGGEAYPLTDVAEGVGGYEWSPDSKRLVLVTRKATPPRPSTAIVIERYQFQSDGDRYRDVNLAPARLQLYDLATKTAAALTDSSEFEEASPSWSPDGT
ncbi:MAG: PD40 domain-containing protein, partial [Steroidobacter sp.]|nr:PD40 domain-containing protein [Steroidobacter sp.]